MKFFTKRALTKKTWMIVWVFTIIINYLSLTKTVIKDNFYYNSLQSPWTENILVSSGTASLINTIYVFIIAGSVLSDTFVRDRKTGLINIIATKENFSEYLRNTILFNMLLVGLLSIIPSLTNLLLWFCLRPNVPLVYFNTMNLSNSLLFSDVFLKSKLLFFILHFIKIALLAMTISNFVTFLNTIFNNRYLGIPIAFILDNIIGLIVSAIVSGIGMSISFFISGLYYPDILTFALILLFNGIAIFYFYNYSRKKDIL